MFHPLLLLVLLAKLNISILSNQGKLDFLVRVPAGTIGIAVGVGCGDYESSTIRELDGKEEPVHFLFRNIPGPSECEIAVRIADREGKLQNLRRTVYVISS